MLKTGSAKIWHKKQIMEAITQTLMDSLLDNTIKIEAKLPK